MNGYNDLLIAVQRAFNVARAYQSVATSSNDTTSSEKGTIPTLKGRIELELDRTIEDFIGNDGKSVTNVEFRTVTNPMDSLVVQFDDGSETVFTMFDSTDGATIHQYEYINGELFEITTHDLDSDGNVVSGSGKLVAEFKADDGTSLSEAMVQDDGSVRFTYSDGTVESLGDISDFVAAPIESVSIVDDYLYFTVGGVTVEAMARDEDGNPKRIQLSGNDGLAGAGFYPNTERDSLRLMRPGTHAFGDEYFIELYDEFSATQPKIYGPLSKNVRVLESTDILNVDMTEGTLTLSYPGGEPLIIPGLDGEDKPDSLDQDRTLFDGEYITSATFDDVERKLSIDTNLTLGKWIIDVPTKQLPSGSGSIISKNTPSPRLPAIVNVEIKDEVSSITIPVSIGRVVGRAGFDGKYSHLSIDDGTLVSTVSERGETTSEDFIDLNYYFPTEIELDPVNDNKVKMVFGDGSVIHTDLSADGVDGLVPRVDPTTWDIGSSEDEYSLSFELMDSEIATDFTNFMKLRPKRGFDVAYNEVDKKLTFTFGETVDEASVTTGVDGVNMDNFDLTDGELVAMINGEMLSSGKLASLTSIDYIHSSTNAKIQLAYSDGSTFDIPYTRPDDGDNGDVWTSMTKEGSKITFEYGDNEFVVNDANTIAWPVNVLKDGSDYTVEFNHQSPEVFTVDDIDGINMSYLSDVTILPNGRYQITMDGTDKFALFEKQEVKWPTDWRVDEDTNELQVRYSGNLVFTTEAIIPDFHQHKTEYDAFTVDGMQKEEGKLVIHTHNEPTGYILTHNGEELVIDGTEGKILGDIVVDHSTSVISFIDIDGETIEDVSIGNFNGVDAVIISSITHARVPETDNELFTFTLSNGDTLELTIEDLHGKNAYYPIDGDLTIIHNDFIFGMSTGGTFEINVPEFQGFVPRWIEDMWLDNSSNLMALWNDVGETTIGRVDGHDANYPMSIREENNEFFIDFSNDGVEGEGSIGTIEGFNGLNGTWISDLTIDENRHLIASISDGTSIDVGLIDGVKGLYPVSITESNDEFTITNQDGSTYVAGTMDGFNGKNGIYIEALRVNSTRILKAEMSDGSDIEVGLIDGINASYIVDFSEDEGKFTIQMNGEDAYIIADIDTFHGNDGEWLIDLQTPYGITVDGETHVSMTGDFDISTNLVSNEFGYMDVTSRRYYVGEFNSGRIDILGAMDAHGSVKFPTRIYEDDSRIMVDFSDDETSVMATISDLNAIDASFIKSIDKVASVYHQDTLIALKNTDDFDIMSNVQSFGSHSIELSRNETLVIDLNTHEYLLGNINGIDASTNIDQVELRGDDLVVTYDSSEEVLIGTYRFVGDDGTWVNGHWTTTDSTATNSFGQTVDVRLLHVPYGNDEIELTADLGEVDGRDFENEIKSITINEHGGIVATSYQDEVITSEAARRRIIDVVTVDDILFLKTNYGPDIEVGYTAGADLVDGNTIEDFEIDRITNRLLVKFSTIGEMVDIGALDRVEFDFATIAASEGAVMDGELFIRLTDGTRFDLGKIRGDENTVDVIDALINIDRELIITRSEGQSTLRVSNITGVDGTGVKGGYVSDGYLYFILDDDSEINAGFVQRDLGFAPFNFIRSYNRGESATRNGRVYVALNNELTEVPSEDSSAWAIVRYENDPSPDAGRPDIISPNDMNEHYDVRPFLVGGEIRTYYSVDSRIERIFAIDVISGNFSSPVYTASENSDTHQVEMDLLEGQEYKWRIRDRVDTGYITDWSLEGTFTVTPNTIALPTISVLGGEDRDAMNINAPFTSSTFVDSSNGTHTHSVWEVKRNSDDEVLVSETVDTNLTSFITPFAILEESSEYSVRVKYITTNGESAFSDWFSFKTKAYFDFLFKPSIEFIGSDILATVARPLFRSVNELPRFYYDYMEEDNVEVFWEVYNELDELIWSDSNRTFVTEVRVGEQLASTVGHKIRVRYDSPRLRGYSEWSDYLEFTPQWSIAKPTITNNSSSPLEVFFDTTFYVGDRTPASVSVDLSGLVLTSGFDFDGTDAQLTLNVSGRAFEIGDTYASIGELSTYLTTIPSIVSTVDGDTLTVTSTDMGIDREIDVTAFVVMVDEDIEEEGTTTTISTTFDIVGDARVSTIEPSAGTLWVGENDTYISHDWEIRTQSDDRLIVGKFADFEREVDWDVMFDETDSLGEYYARVRINGLYGSSEWSDHYNFKLQEIVFTNIYYCTSTGYVVRLDASGSEVWTVRPTTSNIRDIAINDSKEVFAVSDDNNVYKLDDSGETIWTYTGHTGAITSVAFYDEGMIATASLDQTVHLLDSKTGENIWVANDHTSNVNAVVIDLHGDVISGSADNTVRKFSHQDGSLLWTFTSHTATITEMSIDSMGYVYSYSNGSLRKINPRGFQEWAISISNVVDITVDVEDYPYILNSSGAVFKLNPVDGSILDSNSSLLSSAGSALAVDDNIDVFVTSYTVIVMADKDFNDVWSYTNPHGTIRSIEVNRQPIIVKPVGLTGRFYELKPPINLVAF